MLQLLQVYFEPQSSGQTTHVLSLAQGLDKDKYAITVILPSQLRQSITSFRQTGVSVVPLPMGNVLWKPQSIISLMRLIWGRKFDIIHVHSQEAGLLVRIIARAAGAKVIIYTPQCTNIRQTRWFWIYRSIEKILSYITDKIISVSETDRRRIIRWGIPSSKVVSINNGIDPKLNREILDIAGMKQKLDLDEKQPVVMQIGSVSYQKNPLAFVKGASLVINEHPDVKFVLVGDGPLMEEVEEYIQELGIQNQVNCLGWQDNAYNLIAVADIITLTSRWEGLPYALLEAMAWARPVVTTEVNGCPEVVKHGVTGYLVPDEDINTWAMYA
ncbi:glycosyltransferase, partial [bacterium]|nr:glycosyltransferase [bacterium]